MVKFNVGDFLTCVDGWGTQITKGNNYEVYAIEEDYVLVCTDRGENGWYRTNRFKKPTKEIRMIKKIADFDGLQNGFGGELRVESGLGGSDVVILFCRGNYVISFFLVGEDKNDKIEVLKALGFKFSIGKLGIKECLYKFEDIPFVNGDRNWYIEYDGIKGIYISKETFHHKAIGTKYYSEKDSKQICEELNWGL